MAGFKKGFAGIPCFPYSRMLAILALLPPSLRGSAKPTLISWLPFLSGLAGERPREASSSPVERDSILVSLPTTPERLLLTRFRTTSPPASSTRSAIASVLLPSLESFRRNSSGIFTSTLATGLHLLGKYLHIHTSAFDVLY